MSGRAYKSRVSHDNAGSGIAPRLPDSPRRRFALSRFRPFAASLSASQARQRSTVRTVSASHPPSLKLRRTRARRVSRLPFTFHFLPFTSHLLALVAALATFSLAGCDSPDSRADLVVLNGAEP